MNTIQAIEKQFPAHVIAAVESAARIVSRRLKREYNVTLGSTRLRSSGLLICEQQVWQMAQYRASHGLPALDGDARHPRPDQQEFLRDCMVGELMDQYTMPQSTTATTVRRLSPVQEVALISKLRKRGRNTVA